MTLVIFMGLVLSFKLMSEIYDLFQVQNVLNFVLKLMLFYAFLWFLKYSPFSLLVMLLFVRSICSPQ